jgi:HAD superfamily hydrolase (TIGR01509 family)
MKAVLFGSISTLADTSELQRRAFNDIFAEAGLDWHWDQESYRAMLATNGGEHRIAGFARDRGAVVDPATLHDAKNQRFIALLADADVVLRPGVAAVIEGARSGDARVAFATTTSRQTIDALLGALAPSVAADDFALITDVTSVTSPKPSPDVYVHACAEIDVAPADCVAIEDNPGGFAAALAAGIPCVAFPNENTRALDFGTAATVDAITADALASATWPR